jgi:hypothetical protein
VAPHMRDYISTLESNSMPQAFNTNIQQSNSKVLKKLQLKSQIPTE